MTAHDKPTDEALRARLAATDPQRAGAASERPPMSEAALAARIEEVVMTTGTQGEATATASDTATPSSSNRYRALVGAAAAVVALAGVGIAALTLDDDGGSRATTATGNGDAKTLSLALPDPALQMSCVMFDVNVLKDMSPAFAATAVSVSDREVALDVEQWYAGTPAQQDADRVTLERPNPNSSAALDGVAFQEGETYLVTAAEGTVNGCGFSGPATPELRSAFDQAFGVQ